MPIINRIADFHAEMTEWRRELHKHPELSYEEHWTSDFVAKRLESFGVEVHRGLAGTGVVGKLVGQSDGGRAVGLRADMDALPILKANDVDYKSENPGRMHACGHDGHTTMLLGAAKYLAETRNFDGTVYFIFQPAEEGGAGGERMIQDGLFETFDCETVWGMHNWPGMDVGTFAVREGPMMAGTSTFDITVHGRGGHAAMPNQLHGRPSRLLRPWAHLSRVNLAEHEPVGIVIHRFVRRTAAPYHDEGGHLPSSTPPPNFTSPFLTIMSDLQTVAGHSPSAGWRKALATAAMRKSKSKSRRRRPPTHAVR